MCTSKCLIQNRKLDISTYIETSMLMNYPRYLRRYDTYLNIYTFQSYLETKIIYDTCSSPLIVHVYTILLFDTDGINTCINTINTHFSRAGIRIRYGSMVCKLYIYISLIQK